MVANRVFSCRTQYKGLAVVTGITLRNQVSTWLTLRVTKVPLGLGAGQTYACTPRDRPRGRGAIEGRMRSAGLGSPRVSALVCWALCQAYMRENILGRLSGVKQTPLRCLGEARQAQQMLGKWF